VPRGQQHPDFLQLVFAFVNAPLFATFALGILEAHDGAGAFAGLVSGPRRRIHHGLSLPAGATAGVKAALRVMTTIQELAQTFWTAIFAWVRASSSHLVH